MRERLMVGGRPLNYHDPDVEAERLAGSRSSAHPNPDTASLRTAGPGESRICRHFRARQTP
jgi:hypothetical protein